MPQQLNVSQEHFSLPPEAKLSPFIGLRNALEINQDFHALCKRLFKLENYLAFFATLRVILGQLLKKSK